MSRDDCISRIANLVPAHWKADLTNPEVVILFEVFKTTCGITCVRDFHALKKFNLHEIIQTQVSVVEARKEAAAVAAAKNNGTGDNRQGEEDDSEEAEEKGQEGEQLSSLAGATGGSVKLFKD